MRRREWHLTLTSSTVGWQAFVVTTYIGWTSMSVSHSDFVSWSASVCTTWHRHTCLNCAGRPATSKGAVNCAQRLAVISTSQDVDYLHLLRWPSSMELFTWSFKEQYINYRKIRGLLKSFLFFNAWSALEIFIIMRYINLHLHYIYIT